MSEKAARFIDDHFDSFLSTLKGLARIPSVSAPGFPPGELRRSAEAVRAAMAEAGLENTALLQVPDSFPCAYGDWLHAPGKPTLLLYAHHDVQPPGRPEHWKSPAWEPTVRDGRLWGRGCADDKSGVVVHLAAVRAWLGAEGRLPVNVRVLIEGEEEQGSIHLQEILAANRERLRADVIVVMDTGNLEAGLPSLTYRLRGVTGLYLEVEALERPVHSGMGGGPVPDPVMAMSKILASCTDENGVPAIPGLFDQVRPLSPVEREALRKLPFDEKRLRHEMGMLDGPRLVGEPDYTPYERNWVRPSLTVIALEASPIQGSSNQIIPSARARISVRLVPDMDPDRTGRLVETHVKKVAPWGVKVTTKLEHGAAGWITNPEGPAFDAARRALARGFGREAALIGCGGAIGFVAPFSEALGGVPALLLGVEDPVSNAHSENESLNLDDWRKAMKSSVYLFEEIAKIGG